MQIYYEGEQVSMFDQDGFYGRTSRARSRAERRRAKTSGSFWRRYSESVSIPYQFLDLTPGHGDLLGEPYWEIRSPLRGEHSTLNTGESPRDVVESSLSQILEDSVPKKYYLTQTACLGILRRALRRGKELPFRLKLALELQSGLRQLTQRVLAILHGEIGAYHINQRDEGIDLGEVSGALMATTNMQMQTFVTQPEPIAEGFDGYNGDLTGDVASTLGVNCWMSTGRNGIMAFAANQRDEVRDLHDIAGALQASPGMKQQTFVAGFSAGAGASAGGIGYNESVAPTLKGSPSGNCMPSILRVDRREKIYENHGIDARYTGPYDVAPTVTARYGTGGNNTPLVESDADCICIAGNIIDRQPENGGNGMGWQKGLSYTLTATDRHALFARQRVDAFRADHIASTESARQHKDATDLVCHPFVYGQSQFGGYQEGISTLRANGGDHGGGSENLAVTAMKEALLLIRRLIPLECERLQGFPDGWTNVPDASDSARYKALGNSVAVPCVMFLMQGIRYAVDHPEKRQ